MISNQIIKQTTVLWVLIALLLIPTYSGARVVSVQMSAPTIAFGGYSWPGVGQYEKITGVAYAEVDPTDRRNAIIVDIGLAETQAGPGQPGKTPGGKVAYLLNFYILKPVNLNQVDRKLNGYGKMMYEPPNRGGKTWTALGRVSGGGDDPATITDPTILANSFLMPRGYTHSLEWMGTIGAPCRFGNRPGRVGCVADCKKFKRLDDHGSGVRIHSGWQLNNHIVHTQLSTIRHDGQNHSTVDSSRSS